MLKVIGYNATKMAVYAMITKKVINVISQGEQKSPIKSVILGLSYSSVSYICLSKLDNVVMSKIAK